MNPKPMPTKQTPNPERHWAVVPAAGCGARMGAGRPKQYLELAGKTVLEHALDRLLSHDFFAGAAVAVAADDRHWPQLPPAADPRIAAVAGGAERADSVLAALDSLSDRAGPQDWIWVHDAVRPCVPPADIAALKAALAGPAAQTGALLARPILETVKQAAPPSSAVHATLDRNTLWLAQTPQAFRYADLRRALLAVRRPSREAANKARRVTDDAAAIEALGIRPLIIPGQPCNIKLTLPEDLILAEHWLREGAS